MGSRAAVPGHQHSDAEEKNKVLKLGTGKRMRPRNMGCGVGGEARQSQVPIISKNVRKCPAAWFTGRAPAGRMLLGSTEKEKFKMATITERGKKLRPLHTVSSLRFPSLPPRGAQGKDPVQAART